MTGMGKLLHLQGIRGLAICSVIAFHYFPDYFPNGYLGVDLFFVLSGYLMSMMLAKHSSLTFSIVAEFLYRRLKRIAPLYYFIILLTIAIIKQCPCTEVGTNLESASQATWLITNINWDKAMDYFEKLGVSHDLFTHTWSLCLEIQFYLIFPFLWWIQMRYSLNKRMLLLHIISGVSLYFYFINDERKAFNSMFCRTWQFLFGNMVFCLEEFGQEEQSQYDKLPLTEDEDIVENWKEERSADWIFAFLSLMLLFYSMVTEQHLTQNYSRMTTTFVSIILIYFGRNFIILENRFMVFLGEISYAWYLVHWPMVTLQKIFEYTSMTDMFLGVLASITVAILVHFIIEIHYLSWEKTTIAIVVTILLFSCYGLQYYLSRKPVSISIDDLLDTSFEICVEGPRIITNFEGMTVEERKKYNSEIMQHDQYELLDKGCVFNPPRTTLFEGTCRYENHKSNNNRSIVVIGNSWAANSAPLVFQECSPYFGNIHRAAAVACEVLYLIENHETCKKKEKTYFDLVEKVRPDYLFLITRYCYWGIQKSEESWEPIMKMARERLKLLSSQVKHKIFLIHTFPEAKITETQLNNAMEKGIQPEWNMTEKHHVDMSTAQKKLDELLAECPKCEQFDYTSKFLFNGTFYPYHPQHFVTYYSYGLHLTLPALERIRPIYTEICERIGKQ